MYASDRESHTSGGNVSDNSGAGYLTYVAAAGGCAFGWSLGATIASGWEVPAESFLGRSAQNGLALGGLVLQVGMALIFGILTFLLVKKVVDR
jgi:hypothetical protein